MKKRWRTIIDYPDYEISDHGDVLSYRRGVSRLLVPIKHSAGYLCVNLYNSFGHRFEFVHILVAKHFIPNPNNLPQVDHKDRDKENPYFENLEWVTDLWNKTNLSELSRSHGSSGYRGIHWSTKRRKWRASFTFQRKRYDVGFFNDKNEAYIRLKEERECFYRNLTKAKLIP